MPSIGTSFGRYRIVAPLGAGGMGEVYRAHDPQLRRDVALKLLPADQAGNADAIARMVRESRVVAALSHPGIVTVHDVGEDAGHFYLVTELIEGETLRARLSRGMVPMRQAVEIGASIVGALAAAHARGVVHRDLKPENVMLTSAGDVKVLDFGIAKVVAMPDATTEVGATQLTATGAAVGTPAYMAPEQLEGRAVDHRADHFSFGVLVHELITGSRPFKGNSSAEVAASILRDEPPPLTAPGGEVPAPLARIVSRCLAKDPDRRYASTTDLAHAVADLRADFDVLSTPRRTSAVPKRSLRMGAIGAALAAVILTAVAVGWPRGSRPPVAPFGASTRTIAVLPFTTIGDGDAYLADGLSEAVARELGRVDGARVIASSTTFAYRERQESIPEVGRELGASLVVRGSVQHAGERIRITASLVQPDDGTTVWSEQYTRSTRDILAVQDDIAWKVASKLAARLGAAPPPRPAETPMTTAEAYDAYLRGRDLLRAGSASAADAAAQFEQAIFHDPNFALAHAGLASALTQQFFYVTNDPSLEKKALVAIGKALAINPDLAEAFLARAQLLWNLRNGFPHERTIADLKRALEDNPNLAEAHVEIGKLYYHIGLLDKAIAANREALRLDPRSGPAANRVVISTVDAGRREDVADGLARNPQWPVRTRSIALSFLGRSAEAITAIAPDGIERDVLQRTDPNGVALLASLLARVGRIADAERTLAVAIPYAANPTGLSDTHHAQFDIGRTYALLGQPDKALEWITKAANEGYPSYPRFSTDPDLVSLKSHPGFVALLERLRKDHERWSKTL